ncbi:MAG: hypothetical protein ACLFVJ_00270 [Persicimonas sp.]
MSLGALTGCSEEIDGPEPGVEAPEADQDPLPVSPGIVCAEQHDTNVTVSGEGFSPLVIDALEDESRVELPTITLDRQRTLTGDETDLQTVTYSGDPDEPTNRDLLKWHSQEEMDFLVTPELTVADGTTGMLPTGMVDVRVTNAGDTEAVSESSLAVTPRPEVDELSPSIVCLADGDRTVNLSGDTFLEINGQQAQAEVDGVDDPFDIELGDCSDIAHSGIDAQTCSSADLTLADGDVETGLWGVTLQNPETVQCASTDEMDLRVVPPPSIDVVEPPLACVAQEDRTFTVRGSDFLEVDDQTPTVTVADEEFEVTMSDCEDLETMDHSVRSCATMEMVIPEGAVEPGRQEVVVNNPEPAGCANQDQAFVTITNPPAIASVEPAAVCLEDGSREVTVIGEHFITIDGENPLVEFDGTSIASDDVSAAGCESLEADGVTSESCTELVVTVSTDELGDAPPFNPSVSVTNPDPAGCSDTQEDLLTVLEGPSIDSAEPALACTDTGERDIVFTGTNFLTVDGTLPTISFDGTDLDAANVSATDCTTEDDVAGGLAVESCTTLTASVPQGTLAAGDTEVAVTNPDPVGCEATDDTVLTVPPELTIASVTPPNVCSASSNQTNELVISGTGFLNVDGQWFSLDVGDQQVPIDDSVVSDCTALSVEGQSVESCETITVDVDTSGFSEGAVDVSISNPGEATCDATFDDKFGVAAPPTVSSVDPSSVCQDAATDLTLTGEDFAQGAIVTAHHSDGTSTQADTVTFVSDTEIEASFPGGLDDGTYDIEVDNGQGCASTLDAGLVVNPTPVVFFVDPPVLYNGITTEVTMFTSGLTTTPTGIDLVDSNGNTTALTSFSSSEPNRIQATVPSGLTADTYEVQVTSQFGCTGGLPGAVEITDQTNVAVEDIDPEFGWTQSSTSVTVTADDNAAADDQFQAVPRVYLNPVAGGTGTTATELRATTFDSSTELSGIVPSGLSVGEYDVIVVNPDGGVGVLTDENNDPDEGAFEVLADPPPVIDSVDPGTWPDNEVSTGSIRGDNFRLDESTEPDPITVECIEPDGTAVTMSQAAIEVDWATYSASSDQEQSTRLPYTADLNNSSVAQGSVCVVRVTNTDDTFAEFAPVAISWPASAWRVGSFQSSPNLQTARRAPLVTTGQPSRRQRYLYAIGGDDGTATNAEDSVEFSRLNRLGEPTGFDAVPRHSLPPGGLTLSDAIRIDDFIYAVGGQKGSQASSPGATGQILRAKVLDPLNVPEITNVSFEVDQGNGLDEGTYFYRVSAVLDSNSAYNAGGETLASEPLPLNVPASVDGDLVPTISWSDFPDAASYRIYRSPSPNSVAGDEVLVGEVTDDGSSSFSLNDPNLAQVSSDNPLPVGALGEWHEPDSSSTITARHSHGATLLRDPADSDLFHIYVAGGLDANDAALDSVDRVSIRVNGPRSQTVESVSTDAATLSEARYEIEATMATENSATSLSDPPLLYVMGGRTDTGLTNEIEYFEVADGGDLSARTSFAQTGLGNFAGYVGGVANSRMFFIHGENGNANTGSANSAEITSTGANQSPWWTNLTISGTAEDRYLPGRTPLFGIMYVIGGVDASDAPLDTGDFAVVGAMTQ